MQQLVGKEGKTKRKPFFRSKRQERESENNTRQSDSQTSGSYISTLFAFVLIDREIEREIEIQFGFGLKRRKKHKKTIVKMLMKGVCNADLVKTLIHNKFIPTSSKTPLTNPRLSLISCSSRGASSDLVLSEGLVGSAGILKNNGNGTSVSLADRLRLGSLTEDGLSYKENFIVRCYEVGINKTATVETMANILQEVACNHAQSVGFSSDGFATTPTMRKLNLIWVTSRMHIEIYKYPAWGDVVEIETWCQGEGRIGTRRDWILKDFATGVVIGRATSKWVMMNQDTRRLQKVNDDVRDEYLIFCPRSPRLAFPEEGNSSLKKVPKLEDPSQYSKLGLMPRRADFDMNQHVNNVTYIGWVLESIPQEIIDTHELQKITLDYRRECQHDSIVDSLTSPELEGEENDPGHQTNGSAFSSKNRLECCQFLHFLRLSNDGLELNRGRTEWRRKPAR